MKRYSLQTVHIRYTRFPNPQVHSLTCVHRVVPSLPFLFRVSSLWAQIREHILVRTSQPNLAHQFTHIYNLTQQLTASTRASAKSHTANLGSINPFYIMLFVPPQDTSDRLFPLSICLDLHKSRKSLLMWWVPTWL